MAASVSTDLYYVSINQKIVAVDKMFRDAKKLEMF